MSILSLFMCPRDTVRFHFGMGRPLSFECIAEHSALGVALLTV